MKENFAIDAINHIDNDLVEEYAKEKEHLKRKRESKKRAPWIKWASVAACFLLIATVITSIIGILNNGNDDILPMPTDLDSVIWGNPSVGGEEPDAMEGKNYVWKNKNVSEELLSSLQEAKNSEWFALSIGWTRSEDALNYVYEGKTISEWKSERDTATALGYGILDELLKEGDYLKLGEKLYTEGAPDGTKYAKSHYEERIAYYGTELLSKYIVNGNFDRAKVESDRDRNIEEEKSIVNTISDAEAAFYAEKSKIGNEILLEKGYNVVLKNGHYFLFITKGEFSEMSVSEMSNYRFSQASRKAYEDVSIPSIDKSTTSFALDKITISSDYGSIHPKTDEEVMNGVQDLIEKWFYTYDCIQITVHTSKEIDKAIFDILELEHIDSISSKNLPYDLHIISIRYENVDMGKLAELSQNDDVSSIWIEAPLIADDDSNDVIPDNDAVEE